MRESFKKIIFTTALIFLAVACNWKTKTAPPPATSAAPIYNYSHRLEVNQKVLLVEIASDSQSMEQGLSGRDSLQDSQGMLFDFGSNASVTPNFWMKDMKFNLDLIWINKNTLTSSEQVVGISNDVPAPVNDKGLMVDDNTLPLYSAPTPINWVLEVNAGWAKKNNLNIGDEVKLISN